MTTPDNSPDPEIKAMEGKVHEFAFDPVRLMIDYPEATSDVKELLKGLQAQNPTLPRCICAIFAIEVMTAFTKAKLGMEKSYMDALEWLKLQAGDLKTHDASPNQEYSKFKQRARGEQ